MTVQDNHSSKAETLRSLISLLVDYSEVVIADWEADAQHAGSGEGKSETTSPLPSHRLYEAQRVVRGACGMVVDLVQDPRRRLFELSTCFALAQAFDTTVRAGVPDLLARADEEGQGGGVPLAELSRRSGVDEHKLGWSSCHSGIVSGNSFLCDFVRAARVMRVLCSDGLYNEVQPLHYANSPISRPLVGNKPAQAFQLL